MYLTAREESFYHNSRGGLTATEERNSESHASN